MDVYPWGKEWPPPRGAGNFDPSLKVDDFANTSPVGSFAANRFGLYDMGGNVCQWCEDFNYGQGGVRVVRGSSWPYFTRVYCSSWYRSHFDSVLRFDDLGFRCVLEGGSTR